MAHQTVAAIYARTSGSHSKSIREQVDICRARCKERGWTPRFILVDQGESGGDSARPGYNALWNHIESGRIDVLVTWKIDRIARSLADMAAIEEALRGQEVSLHSATEPIDTTTAQGRFVFGILASAGQLERELGSQRVVSILSERAKRGMWMHPIAPFGYCLAKARTLRIHPSEGPQVVAVFKAHMKGRSYSEAAAILNAAGSRRRGKRWTAGTVQRVIENTMHVGRYRHWGHDVVRENLRVVDDGVWTNCSALRRSSARSGKPASQRVRDAAIKRVFDQYICGLAHLDAEPQIPEVR